ncbi:MAG: malonyl CoA-acyl carrier protein transacylase, partial [Gammaproteobacteria bacterium]
HARAVARAVERAKAAGAKRAVMLPVSVPSHCALMQPAALGFTQHLHKTPFRSPSIPVINNVDVAIYNEPEMIRDALARQLYCPVHWSAVVRKMASMRITTLIECGPGKVLTGLNKRIDPALESYSLHNAPGLEQALADAAVNNSFKELNHATE